jgi:hypothetical protein
MGQLVRIGFFFAMRSREYVKVPRAEEGRTKLLVLRNIRFIRDGKVINHNDPQLECADCVAITFEMQKKEEKNDTVHHKRTGDHTMCPVSAAAELVHRIRSYPNTNDETPISAVLMGSRVRHVTSKQVATALQVAVIAIGEDVLNIKAERSGHALAKISGCNGYVPRRTACVPHHADGKMVK